MTNESISKRFSKSIIKIVASLLLAFALGVTIYGVIRMNDQLNAQLDHISKLARTSLQGAIWNLDDKATDEILNALFLGNEIVYIAIVTNGEIFAKRLRPLFKNKDFGFFEVSFNFVTTSTPIFFEEQEIAKVQIALSKTNLKKDLIGQVISIILLALLLIVIITRRSITVSQKMIFGPLMKLENSASAIARGNLDINIPHDRDDEIGNLGKSFDGMRRAVKKLITDLNEINTELEQRVEERTVQLIEAKDKAEAANIAKSQFLSSMSHELRTPLNSVLGFSQLMETDKRNPPTPSQQESLNQIKKSGRHLLDLINEILDLTKIESGKLHLSLESISVRSLIDTVHETMEPVAEKYGITLINESRECGNLYLVADLTRIKQVLINIISNGIKYNHKPGTVTITCEKRGENEVRLSIEDTGKGILKENIPKLFEPFNRLGAEGLDIEGTGIGLTITKKLVEMMDGKISVKSEVGKGSKFFVDFPMGKKPDETIIEKSSSSLPTSEKSPGEQTILYIEDNPANLKLVEKILGRRPNTKIFSSPDAKTGIELAIKHKPDLILMDISLPGMDGYEALIELRALDDTNKIPVIALSANAMEHDIKKGKKAGFDDYITKPLNITKFLEMVDNVLRKTINSDKLI